MKKTRYTISRYDTVPIPNDKPEGPVKYLKRFILYDHFGERIISAPFEERSAEHESMIKLIDEMNAYADAEFKAYNMEIMEYVGFTTILPKYTYNHVETINWEEKKL